jgi:hypothetical protein
MLASAILKTPVKNPVYKLSFLLKAGEYKSLNKLTTYYYSLID